MKATFEFTLPEEREEYQVHAAASTNYCLLVDVEEYARKLRKYDDREMVPKDEIVDALYQLLTDFER